MEILPQRKKLRKISKHCPTKEYFFFYARNVGMNLG